MTRWRTDLNRRMACAAVAAVALAGAWTTAACGQDLQVVIPRSAVFPNYDRVPLGQREGLEAGAYLARTDDAAAAWYNPAGLVLSEKAGLNASATAHEWTHVSIDGYGQKATQSRLSSNSTLVSGVFGAGFLPPTWRLGLAIAQPVSWRPGALEAVNETFAPAAYERLSYKVLSDLSTEVVRLAAGWRASPTLRLGLGVSVGWTSLGLDQSLGEHTAAADSAVTGTRRLLAEGSTQHLAGTLGLQWDPHPRWSVGLRVTTSGLRLGGTSRLVFEAARSSARQDASLALSDDQARFEYRQPAEIAAGLARRFDRGAIEANLRWHAAAAAYDVYTTPESGTLTIAEPGEPVEMMTVAFAPPRHEAREIWNVSVGGRYALSPTWLLHGGFFTDNSPVASATTGFFPKIAFVGGTVGVTLAGSHLAGSVGVGFTHGTSAELPIGTVLRDEVATARFNVTTISLNYAFSYAF